MTVTISRPPVTMSSVCNDGAPPTLLMIVSRAGRARQKENSIGGRRDRDARIGGVPVDDALPRYRFVALALIMAVQTASNLGALGLPALAPLLRDDLGLTRQEA